MKTIQLGDGLTLPLDIITMRSLVLGVSGSGKSTFGRLLAEKIHEAGQRFCVIDLKNDWWGLKSSADGKHAAIPVVIVGGPRADIPLDENAGAAVADIVAETPHSFVIDLDALSKTKGIRFLGAFLERLYDVNREPLLLICDEADRYAPQKPMSVEANVTLSAADDIARRGRKRGIGALWLSQRPAVIAKNVTSQCELVVTFRTTSSLDLKELKEHIGRVASSDQVAATMSSVAGLRDGQAILMSQHPHLRVFKTAQFPMPATFDSSATPRVGARRVEPKQLAAPDLAALGERIQAAAEKAKESDPKHLQAKVRYLTEKLLAAETRAPERQVVEVPVLSESEISRLRELIQRCDAVAQDFQPRAAEFGTKLADCAHELRSAILNHTPAPKPWFRPTGQTVIASRGESAATVSRNGPTAPAKAALHRVQESPLGRCERAILAVLAQHPDGCNSGKLTLLAGYRWSGGFRNSLGALRGENLIEGGNGDVMRITEAGLEALGAYDPLPRPGPELQRYWLGHASLGKGELF